MLHTNRILFKGILSKRYIFIIFAILISFLIFPPLVLTESPRAKEYGLSQIKVSIPEREIAIHQSLHKQILSKLTSNDKSEWKGANKDEFVINPKLYIIAIG